MVKVAIQAVGAGGQEQVVNFSVAAVNLQSGQMSPDPDSTCAHMCQRAFGSYHSPVAHLCMHRAHALRLSGSLNPNAHVCACSEMTAVAQK